MDIGVIKQRLLKDIEMLKSPKGFLNAGHPRYNTLFGRDSLISSWQMLKIEPLIARDTLQNLVNYQGKTVNIKAEEEPGKILHEHRFTERERIKCPNWGFPYYGSIDSTPLFIILAAKYFKQTCDKKFLLHIWNNIVAAINWIRTFGDKDKDGYVEYKRLNPKGLFHQGWRDCSQDHLNIKPPVALVEVQGYVYEAYKSYIFLAENIGKSKNSKEILVKAKNLKRKFNDDYWMEKEKYFALALDGEKKPRRAMSSNPGHLLFTGIVNQNKIDALLSRFFQPDLWTPYGIRTLSTEDPNFNPYSYHMVSVWPHDNWIIYKGIENLGFNHHSNQIKKALLKAYRELGRIPELYTVIKDRVIDLSQTDDRLANPIQAWSSAGLLNIIWKN